MKTVVLTGATGYIGQYATQFLLEKNYVVHAVSSKPRDETKADGAIWHQTDLLNADAVENLIETVRPTHLLHFAWYVEHGKFWNAAKNLDWLSASLLLARKFAEYGGERMITAGTCAEYDWTAESPFVENETPIRPQTLYGASKHALNSTLEKFAATANFSFAAGRIFFPFGGGESPNRLIPSVVCALLENRLAQTSHAEQIRDFMFVEDIAEAFVALLDGETNGAVNIASGKGIRLKEIVETIAKIIGKPELLRIGAIAAANEPLEIIADVRRLRNEVKYDKISDLTETLRKTVDYWKRVYEIND